MINIRLPNITATTEREQLMQVRSYLHQLAGELNWALASLESGGSKNNTAAHTPGNAVTREEMTTSFNELRSLIIKSSSAVTAAQAAEERYTSLYDANIDETVWVEWENVDSVKSPGWYRSQPTSGTSLGGIAWSAAVWFRVDGFDKNACCQTFYLASADGFIVRRQCNGGVWGEFECVNPPMHNGADYRTTERYRGAAVYKRQITMDLTDNNVDTISHGVTGTIIGIHCIVHRSDGACFELTYQASSSQVCCYLIGSIFYVLHNGSCNGSTATITFRYVK